ncbi:hypothetical protein NX059_006836 [Plenodomus lindquistii]|nr:hypothetical protein NX059_006836 [Plenodomus lindquistii]
MPLPCLDCPSTAYESTKRTLLQAIEKRKTDRSLYSGLDPKPAQTAEHKLFVKELETAILQHTRDAHSKIISGIMELPRELRDNIYMHLWEPAGSRDPRKELLYWWESFREPWFSTGDSFFSRP